MIQYKVIKLFTDAHDNFKRYNVGDIYPRDGYTPTEKRIEELASNKNKQNEPVIAKTQQIQKKARR